MNIPFAMFYSTKKEYKMPTPEEIITSVHDELKAGRKIEAIKIIKQATGMGLKESKDIADDGAVDLKPEMIVNLEPVPGSQGCGGTAAAVILMGVGLLYLFTRIS
jgi:hypothetical protein